MGHTCVLHTPPQSCQGLGSTPSCRGGWCNVAQASLGAAQQPIAARQVIAQGKMFCAAGAIHVAPCAASSIAQQNQGARLIWFCGFVHGVVKRLVMFTQVKRLRLVQVPYKRMPLCRGERGSFKQMFYLRFIKTTSVQYVKWVVRAVVQRTCGRRITQSARGRKDRILNQIVIRT